MNDNEKTINEIQPSEDSDDMDVAQDNDEKMMNEDAGGSITSEDDENDVAQDMNNDEKMANEDAGAFRTSEEKMMDENDANQADDDNIHDFREDHYEEEKEFINEEKLDLQKIHNLSQITKWRYIR